MKGSKKMKPEKIKFKVEIFTDCGNFHKCEIMAKNELGAKLRATMICHGFLMVSFSRAVMAIIDASGKYVAKRDHGGKWESL